VDQAVNTFSRLQQVDPCRLDNMDTYSNLLYVKVSLKILCCLHGLLSGGISVVFLSHVGLASNSAADIAAKAALLLPVSNFTYLFGLQITPTYVDTKTMATTLEF